MKSTMIEMLPRVEGQIRVVLQQTEEEYGVLLESGRSIHMENTLIDRYPLEAVHLTQGLSGKSGIANGLAASMALENYLQIKPTHQGFQLRDVLLKLSSIYSHIHHFYWELLPDFLNEHHFHHEVFTKFGYYPDLKPRSIEPSDLPEKQAHIILNHLKTAADILQILQQIIASFGGKYPVIMNLIPGGVTNFEISPDLILKNIRRLESCKPFIEKTWPEDVRIFIKAVPESIIVFEDNLNLLSFGATASGKSDNLNLNYSPGVLLDGKLEPINELRITESLDNTFYLPINQSAETVKQYDLNKLNAYTWIKGARYETETVLTGALARMLITHFGGGDINISNTVIKLIDSLGLSVESPNCIASRMMSEALEARFYVSSIFKTLLGFDYESTPNLKIPFDFSRDGSGTGKIEAPGGALYHQVFIQGGRILQYRIISPVNWNFSTVDEFGKTGVVETELNKLLKNYTLGPVQVSRILHSYNAHILEGTQ